MFKASVKSIINYLGFDLTRKKSNLGSTEHGFLSEANKMIQVVRNNTMVGYEGLNSLYLQALFCEKHKLDGDFIECGVWKGGCVGIMALVNLKYGNSRRHIHLFDSFEEICEPDEKIDGDRATSEVMQWAKKGGTKGRLVPLRGFYDNFGGPGTIKENTKLLETTIGYDQQYIHFYKGWFQQTLPKYHKEIDKIAILRIDGDWYASTKICLEYLFDKVITGGFVIFDDYGVYDGCRKAVDEFIESIGRPLFLNHLNSEISYIIVP